MSCVCEPATSASNCSEAKNMKNHLEGIDDEIPSCYFAQSSKRVEKEQERYNLRENVHEISTVLNEFLVRRSLTIKSKNLHVTS